MGKIYILIRTNNNQNDFTYTDNVICAAENKDIIEELKDNCTKEMRRIKKDLELAIYNAGGNEVTYEELISDKNYVKNRFDKSFTINNIDDIITYETKRIEFITKK